MFFTFPFLPCAVLYILILFLGTSYLVTMQAQREAPPDLVCRDKFLIQSTVVPVGTNDEDITSATVSYLSALLVVI